GHDDVTESGVTTTGAPEHADGEQLLGAGVVGDLEAGFLLQHGLLRLLVDLDQAPALGGAQRASLRDRDEVADAGGVVLVVCLDLRARADDLAVQRVLHAVLDLDDDGLVHLVARHITATHLAVPAGAGVLDVVSGGLVTRLRRLRGGLLGLGHYLFASSAVSSAGASAASAFLVDFLVVFAGTSIGAGVARMPSSRSRMTV